MAAVPKSRLLPYFFMNFICTLACVRLKNTIPKAARRLPLLATGPRPCSCFPAPVRTNKSAKQIGKHGGCKAKHRTEVATAPSLRAHEFLVPRYHRVLSAPLPHHPGYPPLHRPGSPLPHSLYPRTRRPTLNLVTLILPTAPGPADAPSTPSSTIATPPTAPARLLPVPRLGIEAGRATEQGREYKGGGIDSAPRDIRTVGGLVATATTLPPPPPAPLTTTQSTGQPVPVCAVPAEPRKPGRVAGHGVHHLAPPLVAAAAEKTVVVAAPSAEARGHVHRSSQARPRSHNRCSP